MADFVEGTWVSANRDFGYDDQVGEVKRGQVFQTGGHINDEALAKHNFFSVLDPQPLKKVVAEMPKCGECKRVFFEDWLRDRCGQLHEDERTTTAAERLKARREKATDRMEAAQDAHMLTLGA